MRRIVTAACFIGLLVLGLGDRTVARGDEQATPTLSPVQIANQEELRRVMGMLKISGMPPGAVSSSPATYDEATANPYPNLPDPLVMKNGRKVTSASIWRQRRAELVEDFEREVYGRRPKATPRVTWQIASTANGHASGPASA